MIHIDSWSANFNKLAAYAQVEGHGSVPTGYVHPDGTKLGNWANYQRTRYRQGKLDMWRAELLSDIDGWEWGPLRPGPRPDSSKKERDDQIYALWKKGSSLQEIADAVSDGISRQRVHQIVQRRYWGD